MWTFVENVPGTGVQQLAIILSTKNETCTLSTQGYACGIMFALFIRAILIWIRCQESSEQLDGESINTGKKSVQMISDNFSLSIVLIVVEQATITSYDNQFTYTQVLRRSFK